MLGIESALIELYGAPLVQPTLELGMKTGLESVDNLLLGLVTITLKSF